jgi:hypothetical protein
MRIGFKRRNRHDNDCRAGADCGRSEALTSRRYADGKKTSGIAASVRTAEPVLSFSLDLAESHLARPVLRLDEVPHCVM